MPPAPAPAPTTTPVTVTVGPAGAYSTLAGALAGEQRDLLVLDEELTLELEDYTFNEVLVIDAAWGTGPANRLILKAAAGAEARVDSGSVAGAKIAALTSEGTLMVANAAYTTFWGIGFDYTADASNAQNDNLIISGDYYRLHNCTVRYSGYNYVGTSRLIDVNGRYGETENCLFWATVDVGYKKTADYWSARDCALKNCTFINVDWSCYNPDYYNAKMYNCAFFFQSHLAENSGLVDNTNSFKAGNYKNCAHMVDPSVDGWVGENILTTLSASDFVDEANNDFRINENSLLYNSGFDFSTDFTDDIRGTATRYAGQWDIGAFKFDLIKYALRETASWDMMTTTEQAEYAGQYTSITSWEAGEQTDLSVLGESVILECFNDWVGGLAEKVALSTWPNAHRKIHNTTIRAASGHSHNGAWGAGFTIRRSVGYGTLLDVPAHVTIQDICAENTTASGTANTCVLHQNATAERCMFKCADDSGGDALIATGTNPSADYGASPIANNCIVLDCAGHGIVTSKWAAGVFRNCTAMNCGGIGIVADLTGYLPTIENCVAFGNAGGDFFDSGTMATIRNNASGDLTAPGTNPITGITTADFEDYAGGSYRPAAGGALAGAGVDLSAEFTDDITGDTRTQWDIGAYLATAESGPTSGPTIVVRRQRFISLL